MNSSNEAIVLVIYTGGTIGMVESAGKGYVPCAGFLSSNLRSQARFHDPLQESVFAHSSSLARYEAWTMSRTASGTASPASFSSLPIVDSHMLTVHSTRGTVQLPSLLTPKTQQGKRIRYCILEYDPLIDSSEIEMADWIKIATDIELNYASFDSFCILHGTDTMSYTASALSFLLENLGKTVIITGAQVPLSSLFNDSIDNLLGALVIAASYIIPEVSLFFNHKLLRGNRTIKSSSVEFDAFLSPNLPPLATIGIDIAVAWNLVLAPGQQRFTSHKAMSSQVATIRIFPGISGTTLRALLGEDIRGVVIHTFGAGNTPRRPEILSAFADAAKRGVILVNVTQCAHGSVAPDTYETGRLLTASGVTNGGDMTVEAALAKLAYLLSKANLTPGDIRQLISRPLRGELTPATAFPTYSTPLRPEDRLRSLLARVVECSFTVPSSVIAPAEDLPEEFRLPLTTEDTEIASKALLPILLSQAAARSDPSLLSSLIDSILLSSALPSPSTTASPADGTPHPCLALSILDESATASLQTPLHLAVIAANLTNVQLLLSHGASVHIRDAFHHSVLFYAARLGGTGVGRTIVECLRGAGAHLGEREIERGEVGLEIACAERGVGGKANDNVVLWELAAGEKVERARKCFKEYFFT